MICNDCKPLHGVVSSRSRRGKQRTIDEASSKVERGNTVKPRLAEAGRAMARHGAQDAPAGRTIGRALGGREILIGKTNARLALARGTGHARLA